jgi:transposase-like protein
MKKRKALVRLVVEQGKTLSEAGRKLHINPSTVRLIIKKYK